MKTSQTLPQLDLAELTRKLKYEDQRYARLSKGLQITFWILVPGYAFLSILHYYDGEPIQFILGNTCLMASMTIFAVFFKYFYRDYTNIDYSLPTVQMLKKAVYRYQPIQYKKLWFLPALALMDLGLSLQQTKYTFPFNTHYLFWGLMGMGMLIGLVMWKLRYQPLFDSAKQLVREMESDF